MAHQPTLRFGPYSVHRPPLSLLTDHDWSTAEAARRSFAAIIETDPDGLVVTGQDGGPYGFSFADPAITDLEAVRALRRR
jgi:hypothetical protein